jgi:methionine synthase II (cobalamin-independent)
MLRTTVVGSWPPEERYRAPLALYFSGQMDQSESETLLKEVAAVAIAQQQACGLDEYTGGETSADSFILHFPRLLTGIKPTDQLDAWGRPRILFRDESSRRARWTWPDGCPPARARN